VPIYTFGETDIYSQPKNPKGSLLRTFEDRCIDVIGAAPIFGYGFGLLPRRQAITSVGENSSEFCKGGNQSRVLGSPPYLSRHHGINYCFCLHSVGAPILVEKMDNPPQAYIDSLHEKYVAALTDLYHTYRDQYGHPDSELIIC